MNQVSIRQWVSILAGLAALALGILVVVSHPDADEGIWLGWAAISAAIGLVVHVAP
jgi:hypothetical protein